MRCLEAVLDEEPLLSEQLMGLAEWMAGYYLAPLGEVLRGMLPLMAEVRRTVYYRITDLGRDVLAKRVEGDGGRRRIRKGTSGLKPGTILGHLMPGLKPRPTGSPTDFGFAGSKSPVSKSRPGRPGVGEAQGEAVAGRADLELRVLTRLAEGEAVKVSTLRTATAATLPVLAGLCGRNGLRGRRRRWSGMRGGRSGSRC